MKIRDVDVDFSFTDADDIEKFEIEAKKIEEISNNYEKKEMSTADVIREECNIIENFFDNVFEKGISQRLFKGKKDLKDHITLFEDVVKAKIEQVKDIQNVYNNIENADRYKPNREIKRFNNHKGRK